MEALLNRRGVALALICACGLLVFHNSFGNSFHYDDEHSILENPHIRSLANVPRFFVDPGTFSGLPEARMYRPLLLATYALNYATGGYQISGYHLVNLLLHLLNAWLVWKVGEGLLEHRRGTLLAGLLFAVHPLMSEPVSYISSRSSLLAVLFYLLALLLLVGETRREGSSRALWGIAVCYLAALSSKSIAITFPALGTLYLLWVAKRRFWRLLVLPAILSGLYVLGTRAIVGKALLQPVRGYAAQTATQVKAAVYYLWTVGMPVHLSVEPQFRVAEGFGELSVVLAGLLLASLVFAGLRGHRREPLLVFCGGWFLLGLLPSSLVPLNVVVNEHRLYLPMLGAALGLGALVGRGDRRVRWSWALVLLALAVLCAQRNRMWESEEILWADAVAKGPQMPRPHVNLGKAYLEQGRYQEAIAASQRALEINPNLERAHYNIGTAHLYLEEYDLAVAHYLRALEIGPDLVQAHNNLGNAYQEQGRYQEAAQAYRKALDIQVHPSFYHNLGNVFLEQGKPDSARVSFRRALALDPGMRESYKGLVKACRAEELLQTALEVLQEALERWPGDFTFLLMMGDAHAALGREEQAIRAYRQGGLEEVDVWLKVGDQARLRRNWQKAEGYYERAVQAGREEARVYNALGEVRYGQDRVREALEAFRRAAQLDSELAVAYANIGRVYLKHGGTLEAMAALERAVELAPEEAALRGLLAEAYRRGGKAERAIRAYQEAIRLAPGKAEFYHNLGFMYEQAGHWAEAERMYRAALERDPQLVDALFNLGFLQLKQKRFAEAASTYQQVLASRPDHARACINLASAWVNLGETQKAMAAYERFLELSEDEELRGKALDQLTALKEQLE